MKCSGDHPACERCLIKGLVCEYAAEGRVRGPNKLKTRAEPHREFSADPSYGGQAPNSSYAFTEHSPSAHHARAHGSGPSRSHSELRYSGGVDIERLYSNPSGVPYRPVYLEFFAMLILIFKFADHYQVLIQVPTRHPLTTLQLLAQQRIYNINTALGLPSRAMNASTIIRSAIPRKVATVIN
jgi:hypothetical protein